MSDLGAKPAAVDPIERPQVAGTQTGADSNPPETSQGWGEYVLGAAGILVLVAFGLVALLLGPDAAQVVGFLLTAGGGLAAVLGEAAGTRFGTRKGDSPLAAGSRAVGLLGLTLGALLLALPGAEGVIARHHLKVVYGIVALIFALGAIAWAVLVIRRDGANRRAEVPPEPD